MDEKLGSHWWPIIALTILAIGLGAWLAFKSPPPPPPKNASAFGCYTSSNSAPILLSAEGMMTQQPDFPKMRFRLEMHKTGIALVTGRPIALALSQGRYIFSIKSRGTGTYLPFYRQGGDSRYGVFDEDELSSFSVIADDSQSVLYSRSPESDCAT